MATTWTPERWARQAAMIRTWKPWERSTGPSTPEGKAKASRNAWSGGHWKVLQRFVEAQDPVYDDVRAELM